MRRQLFSAEGPRWARPGLCWPPRLQHLTLDVGHLAADLSHLSLEADEDPRVWSRSSHHLRTPLSFLPWVRMSWRHKKQVGEAEKVKPQTYSLQLCLGLWSQAAWWFRDQSEPPCWYCEKSKHQMYLKCFHKLHGSYAKSGLNPPNTQENTSMFPLLPPLTENSVS